MVLVEFLFTRKKEGDQSSFGQNDMTFSRTDKLIVTPTLGCKNCEKEIIYSCLPKH